MSSLYGCKRRDWIKQFDYYFFKITEFVSLERLEVSPNSKFVEIPISTGSCLRLQSSSEILITPINYFKKASAEKIQILTTENMQEILDLYVSDLIITSFDDESADDIEIEITNVPPPNKPLFKRTIIVQECDLVSFRIMD